MILNPPETGQPSTVNHFYKHLYIWSMAEQTYQIDLPQFQGPFDLLLFFIERDELDIYDIPIAKITDDFLAYIRQMESLNVDLASEFILVAATLMRIKAKMLLPRKELDEQGNEIDPRQELVERLLEYKRYKSVIDELKQMEEDRATREVRGYTNQEVRQLAERLLVDVELESVSLFKLMNVFQKMMAELEARENRIVHRIYRYNYTIQEQSASILSRIRPGHRTTFRELFDDCENRVHAIVNFLALLELLNAQRVSLIQGSGPNDFWVTAFSGEEE